MESEKCRAHHHLAQKQRAHPCIHVQLQLFLTLILLLGHPLHQLAMAPRTALRRRKVIMRMGRRRGMAIHRKHMVAMGVILHLQAILHQQVMDRRHMVTLLVTLLQLAMGHRQPMATRLRTIRIIRRRIQVMATRLHPSLPDMGMDGREVVLEAGDCQRQASIRAVSTLVSRTTTISESSGAL